MAPARFRVALTTAVAACAVATSGCVPNGFGEGSCTSSPPTTIAFVGGARDTATAGQPYFQSLSASAGSLLGVMHGIELVQAPDGASATAGGVSWLPPAALAGTTQRFRARSEQDFCGYAAAVAWSVRVYPPIEIAGFEATPAVVPTRGATVRLVATFTGGSGQLVTPFTATVQSGVPLDVGVVSATTEFRLAVVGPGGAVVEQVLTVEAQAPPLITDPSFYPPIAKAGDVLTLSWGLGGKVTSLTLDPGGVALQPFATFWYPVGAPGVTYTLTARNDVGDVTSATFSPVVLPIPVISSFSVSPASPAYLGTTAVTAVFEGGEGALQVPGVPPVPITSGVPVTVGPLHGGVQLELRVTNAAAMASQGLTITLSGPGTWELLPFGPGAGRSAASATRLPDGRVLVAGGDGYPSTFDTTELWDPVDGATTPGPRLRHARARHAAALLADGRVLLAGGQAGPGRPVDEAEVLDLAAGTSTAAGSVGPAWWFPQLVALPDGAAVLHPASMYATAGTPILRFDPGSSTLAPLTTAALGWVRSFALADGRVLLLAGGRYALTPSAILDPASGALTDTGATPRVMASFEALALADRRVLVLDGQAPALLFDPAAGTFGEAGTPLVPGMTGPAIQLPGGDVLVAGTVSMLFEPATLSFRETGGMLYGAGHPLVLLTDGSVMATGNAVERYRP